MPAPTGPLTPTQLKVLEALRDCDLKGTHPTYREPRAIAQRVTEGILHRLSQRRFQVLDRAGLRAQAEASDWA